MKEKDIAYLKDVTFRLTAVINEHVVCFEDNSTDCMFDQLQEAVEIIDSVVDRVEERA